MVFSYTMTTVGSEGFLSMLPVYLEHVLFPTLTEAGYVTEVRERNLKSLVSRNLLLLFKVHHVNGEGEDAGVVYCEMQVRIFFNSLTI